MIAVEQNLEKDWDKWVVALALFFLVLSTIAILDDRILFRPKVHHGDFSLGQLLNSTNDVRRKGVSELAYLSARDSDTIFLGDTIFTGDQSSVDIKFNKGSDLSVGSNTMIVIESVGDKRSIDIKNGTLSATLDKNDSFIVKNQGQDISLSGDSTKIRLARSNNGTTSIAVEEGALDVRSASRHELLLKNQEAILQKGGSITIEEHNIEQLEPLANAEIWLMPSQLPTFKWKTKGTAKRYRLVISQSVAFNDVIFSKMFNSNGEHTLSVTAEDLPVEVPLFWKIELDSKKETSSTREFTIHREQPLELQSPKDGEKFQTTQLSDGPISFAWRGSHGGTFEIQISQDLYFNDLLLSKNLTKNTFKLALNPEGIYYWRVRPVGQSETKPWSAPSLFYVVGEKPLSAPEISNYLLRYRLEN